MLRTNSMFYLTEKWSLHIQRNIVFQKAMQIIVLSIDISNLRYNQHTIFQMELLDYVTLYKGHFDHV